jgi:hypothetical protein
MARSDLTAQRLRELLHYDHGTGVFTRRVSRGPSRVGCIAGSKNRGYLQIKVDGKIVLSHRLAWLAVYGEFPAGEIDHIDGDRSNNAIANLRVVTRSINMQNLHGPRRDNNSGFLGVSWDGLKKKWLATIQLDGKQHFLGRFDIAKDAHCVYLEAKRRMHPGCAI